MQSKTFSSNFTQHRLVAYMLMICGVFSIITMAFHPTISAVDPLQQLAEIKREYAVNASVHGLMIIYGLLCCGCLTYFFSNQIKCRAFNVLTITFYVSGTVAMIVAALINGFIFPEYAMHTDRHFLTSSELYQTVSQLTWTANQVFAYFGASTLTAAVVVGSASLFFGARHERLVGMLGLLIGSLLLGALQTGWLSLNVNGMKTLMIGLGIWYLAVAASLFVSSRCVEDLELSNYRAK